MPFARNLVIVMDWIFAGTALALMLWLIVTKTVRNAIDRYLSRRQAVLEALVQKALFKDPAAWDEVVPQKWGDRKVLWTIFVQVAENFSGDITTRMVERLRALGLFDDAIARLQSHDWWVRAEAAYHLGLVKDPAPEKALLEALNDKYPRVVMEASRALIRLKGCEFLQPILSSYTAQWGSPSPELATILYEMGPEASPSLAEQLSSLSHESQLIAIDILGYFKNPYIVSRLLTLVTTPDDELRARVVKALGQIAHPSALPAILEASEDPSAGVRVLACGALRHWVEKKSIAALARRLNDSSLQVRLKAAQALSLMGKAGNRALIQAREKSLTTGHPSLELSNPATGGSR